MKLVQNDNSLFNSLEEKLEKLQYEMKSEGLINGKTAKMYEPGTIERVNKREVKAKTGYDFRIELSKDAFNDLIALKEEWQISGYILCQNPSLLCEFITKLGAYIPETILDGEAND